MRILAMRGETGERGPRPYSEPGGGGQEARHAPFGCLRYYISPTH